MKRTSGAARIFMYNWPTYLGTWALSVAVLAMATRVGGAIAGLAALGAGVALVWSVFSLVVSYYVYDRSHLYGGSWVPALLPDATKTWATVDAGLDAEVALDGSIPGDCIARLDVFDGDQVRAPSVQRARAITPREHVATRAQATALPLADASCDVVTVVFTAHELRNITDRERFFREVRRVLRAQGRMLLVEHLRDGANFAAFGPGFLHFLPRSEWMRLAQLTGLVVVAETRVTPWVMALALEKSS